MYDVIISGYYGFDNSGDDALLMAIIEDLRAQKEDISILVLSKKPNETKDNYNVDSINRFNIFKVIKNMRKSRLLINGGGSLIQDVTSSKSLYYYLGIIILAKLLRVKVMVYANGIGPVEKKINKRVVKKILNTADYITLREKKSVKELENLKVLKPPVEVTADPALNIKPEKKNRIDQLLKGKGIENTDNIIGFSLREWGDKSKHIEIIADSIDYMVKKHNICPLFIPMHYPHDIRICEDVANKMESKAYIMQERYLVSEIVGIIEKCKLLVGMRLHSLIYAVSVCVPVIGLAYDPKIKGFLEYTGQMSELNLDHLSLEELIKALEKSWKNKELIRDSLMQSNKVLKIKARENAKIAISLLEDGDC